MIGPLLRAAIVKPSAICFDLALDLLVLPLSYVVISIAGFGILAGIAAMQVPAALSLVWVALGCALCLAIYVLRGWQLSGLGARGLLDLIRAPEFILWKQLIGLRKRSNEWTRTERKRAANQSYSPRTDQPAKQPACETVSTAHMHIRLRSQSRLQPVLVLIPSTIFHRHGVPTRFLHILTRRQIDSGQSMGDGVFDSLSHRRRHHAVF